MSTNRSVPNRNSEYARSFSRIRGGGSDSSTDAIESRFGMLENMYIDYEGGGDAVESIPGFRRLLSFGMNINGIYHQRVNGAFDYLIVHAGKYIFRFKKDELDGAKLKSAIAVMRDTRSAAFTFESSLYIIDGESMLRINESGAAFKVGEAGGLTPYIPTTFLNGEPREKRNLLSRYAYESFVLDTPRDYIYGTRGLKFSVTDEEEGLCAVVGCEISVRELHIPTYALISGKKYRVTEIYDRAFSNNKTVETLITNIGLKRIGKGAFSGCTVLKEVNLSYTVSEVGEEAFRGCALLGSLHFNTASFTLGAGCFADCTALNTVFFVTAPVDTELVFAGTGLENADICIENTNEKLTLSFKPRGHFSDITEVKLDGVSLNYVVDRTDLTVRITVEREFEIKGKTLTLKLSVLEGRDLEYGDGKDFLATEMGVSVGIPGAILGCTVAAAYDGRVFLSGNPLLPGVVFYSEKNTDNGYAPIYFSADSYFIDGVANNPITALLVTHGSLAVFKEKDDGMGTILYHEPKESASNRSTYPISYSHGSIPTFGAAVNFFDEIIFATERGICALDKTSSQGFREVRCRSELINPMLFASDLKRVRLTEWKGYLVAEIGDTVFLADSRDSYTRDGIRQYEWYRLTNIGTYKNDVRVFRYSDEKIEGYDNHENIDAIASGEAYSEPCNGRTVYFIPEGDKKWLVCKTEEFTGGSFDPCSTVFSDGDRLYFATEGGDLCVFNTDKRGVAPDCLKLAEGFSETEYASAMGKRIHPYFYSFDRHAVSYGACTPWDNCGLPYLTKSSVRNTLTLKLRALGAKGISAYLETDKGGIRELGRIPLATLSFDCIDFSDMTSLLGDYSTVTLPEAEKDWTEKRIILSSKEFCSPFGVYSVSYRYKIKGKIK